MNHIPFRGLDYEHHDQSSHGSYKKAEGIDLHDGLEGRRHPKYGKYPRQPHAADADDGARRRDKGHAESAQVTGHGFLGKAEYVGKENILQADLSGADDVRVCVKNPEQLRAEQEYQRADHKGAEGALQQAQAQHALTPVIFPGAVILAHEGGTGLAEGVHDIVGKYFKVVGSGRSCHNRCAEAVDRGLDDDIREGKDHALDACGYAYFQNLDQDVGVNAQL